MKTRTSEKSTINFSNKIREGNIERFRADLQADTFAFTSSLASSSTLYFEHNFLAVLDYKDIERLMNVIQRTQIRTLYLGHNNIGYCTKRQIEALTQGFKYLEILHLDHNHLNLLSTTNIEVLSQGLNNLKELHIHNNNLSSMDTQKFRLLINKLKQMNLHKLNISDTNVPHETQEKISQEFNKTCFKIKGYIERFFFWHPLTKQITANHLAAKKHISVRAVSEIQDLQKNIAHNCLQNKSLSSLTALCIFRLYEMQIVAQPKKLPAELQTEIAEISGRLKL